MLKYVFSDQNSKPLEIEEKIVAPFTNFIREVNNVQEEKANDLNNVMSMYYLID